MFYGIDFGTSNSVLSTFCPGMTHPKVIELDSVPREWRGLDLEKVLPTVMSERETGGFRYGWEAKFGPRGHHTLIKRVLDSDEHLHVGGVQTTPTTAAAAVLAEIRQRAMEAAHQLESAVITVPANATGRQRFRTLQAARRAGISVTAVINEPTAAALAFIYRMPRKKRDGSFVVFDWGGGTLDITQLEHRDGLTTELRSESLTKTGGVDFDARFRTLLDSKGARFGGSRDEDSEIERLKIDLSQRQEIQVPHGGRVFTITRDEFNDCTRDLVDRAMDLLGNVLQGCGPTTVVSVGGTSRIPAVRNAIERVWAESEARFAHAGSVRSEINQLGADAFNPLTAVAEGAAIAAAINADALPGQGLRLAAMNDLGVIACRPGSRTEYWSILIPRGTRLPHVIDKNYRRHDTKSEPIRFKLVEGDATLPPKHPENVVLFDANIPVPHAPAVKLKNSDPRLVTVRYEYDINGLMRVSIHSEAHGQLFVGRVEAEDDLPDAKYWESQLRRLRSAVGNEEGFMPSSFV